MALKALHAETGEPRFATVQALVRRPETAADAYVAMVEENEIRVGLSQYERARVAARATERGVFPSEKAALLALFAAASRPKRSRIRAFLELYHALDGVAALSGAPARAAGAAARRAGAGRRRRADRRRHRRGRSAHRRRPSSRSWARWCGGPRPTRPSAREELRPGVTLADELRGHALTLRLEGEGVTAALRDAVRALLRRELGRQG